MNKGERATFIARLALVRRSYDAWDDFCAALTPGPEMDACIEAVVLGTSVFLRSNSTIPTYSLSYKDILEIAVDENNYLSLRNVKDNHDEHQYWECCVEFEGYHGEGQAHTVPEAVCRALLNLYAPSVTELAGEEDVS